MLAETIAALVTARDGIYVDGTLGEAGHARAILAELEPGGRLLGFDRDPTALAIAQERLVGEDERVTLLLGNFRDLAELLPREVHGKIDGILLDLGLRSSALDDPARGFAFRSDGPLDMRFNPSIGEPASELLARIDQRELAEIFAAGTTRANPHKLAAAIVTWRSARPLATTGDLVRCIRSSLHRWATPKLLSSLFSALRMKVNGELEDLDHALVNLPGLLKTGGVLCVLAYQSQEDRRVKNMRRAVLQDPKSGDSFRLEQLTKKPLMPTREEARQNRRARSARLRALRRMPLTMDT